MPNFLSVKNNASSILAAGISAGATSLTVASGEGAPFPTSNFHITVDNEILKCTLRSGDVFTVTRAQEGTQAATHNQGAAVRLNITAAVIQELQTYKSYFVPKSVSDELFRQDSCVNSSFEGEISGTPTATSVVYKSSPLKREYSLPQTTYSQFGKVILHNITRGNSRKITGVNFATKTITTVSSADNWANGDTITTGSQTCVYGIGGDFSYSKIIDVDISAEVPATAKALLVELFGKNKETSGGPWTVNPIAVGPFETYAAPKFSNIWANLASESSMSYAVVPIIDGKICLAFGAWGSIQANGCIIVPRLRGYWE